MLLVSLCCVYVKFVKEPESKCVFFVAGYSIVCKWSVSDCVCNCKTQFASLSLSTKKTCLLAEKIEKGTVEYVLQLAN